MSCQPDRCAGRDEHDRLKRDTREWLELPLVGIQRFDDDDGPVELELRNCNAGSTLARQVRP